MSHLGAVLAFVGRLEAIRRALDYDLSDIPIQPFETRSTDPRGFSRLWHTNMKAWRLVALG